MKHTSQETKQSGPLRASDVIAPRPLNFPPNLADMQTRELALYGVTTLGEVTGLGTSDVRLKRRVTSVVCAATSTTIRLAPEQDGMPTEITFLKGTMPHVQFGPTDGKPLWHVLWPTWHLSFSKPDASKSKA